MDTNQILNRFMNAKPGDNIRAKSFPLYHNLTISSGQTTYPTFTSDIAYSTSNIKLPLSGTQMFTCTDIKMRVPSITGLTVANLGLLLFNSYLTFYLNGRLQVKLPFHEFLTYPNEMIEALLQTITLPYETVKRIFAKAGKGFPIFINSTADIEISVEIPSAIATLLDGKIITLTLDGWLADKLTDFTYDDLGDNRIQTLKDSIYAVTTYQSGSTVEILQSKPATPDVGNSYFPLSNLKNFQVEAVSFAIATDQDISAVEDSLRKSYCEIILNDTKIFESNLLELTSIHQTKISNFTSVTPASTAYSYTACKRKGMVLGTPILVGPVATVQPTIVFAFDAALDTNPFLVDLMGTGQRRVA